MRSVNIASHCKRAFNHQRKLSQNEKSLTAATASDVIAPCQLVIRHLLSCNASRPSMHIVGSRCF
jgi:hypothetical protein